MSHDATRNAEIILRGRQDLNLMDRLVYTKLANYCGDKKRGERAYMSIETLAGQTHRSTRTVQRSLKKLEERGLIVRDNKKGGKGNDELRYRLPSAKEVEVFDHQRVTKGDTFDDQRVTFSSPKGDISDIVSDPKGDISDHQRVTFSAPKGDISVHVSYEQEQREEQPRSGAARAIAQSDKKPSLDAANFADTSLPQCFADAIGFWDPFFADGTLFADVFWWAECYLPEFFSDPPTSGDFARYAKWTREEFEDWVIRAGYQCSVNAAEIFDVVARHKQVNHLEGRSDDDSTKTIRAPKAQAAIRRRGSDSGKPDGLRSHIDPS